MQNSSHIDLTDLYATSFLISQGAQLEGTERTPDGRVHFLLRRMEGTDELLETYWKNVAVPVVPAQLYSSLKFLKSIIHSQR